MTKKRSRAGAKRREKPMPSFEGMVVIDPDEFSTAVNFAINASSGQAITIDPSKMKFNLEQPDGSVDQFRFTDTPTNRVIFALQERYGKASAKFYSATCRFLAYVKILRSPELSEWVRRGSTVTEIHPAVIDAASSVTMDSEGDFPIPQFIARVKELAATKYRDVPGFDA